MRQCILSNKKIIWLMVIFQCACFATMGQAQPNAGAADPNVWTKPTKAPAMREVLTGKEYTDAFNKMAAVLEPALLKNPAVKDMPDAYLVVHLLKAGSKAEQNGLRRGDKLFTLNGKQLWHSLAPLPWKAGGNQVLEVESANGQKQQITLPGIDGLEGATLQHQWELLYWSVKNGQRNSKWDLEFLIGLYASSLEPDLAETAWFHAIRKGYKPDVAMWWAGATLASHQNRHEVAFDFSAFVPENAFQSPRPMPFEIEPAVKSRWAMGSHRLDEFLDVQAKGLDYTGRQAIADQIKALANIHKARPVNIRTLPPPSVRAKSLRRKDILDEVVNHDPKNNGSMLRAIQKREVMNMPVETDSYQGLLCGLDRKLTRAELIVRFSLRPTDNRPGRFGKELSLGLVKAGTRGHAPLTLDLSVISGNPTVGVGFSQQMDGPTFRYFDRAVTMDGKAEHTARIIRVDGQVELFLNDKRLAYLPVDDALDKTDFMIWSTGTTVVLHKVEMYELVERIPLPAP